MVVEDPNYEENRNTMNVRLRKLFAVALLLLVIGVLLFSLTRLFSSSPPSSSSPVSTITSNETPSLDEDILEGSEVKPNEGIDFVPEEESSLNPLDEVLAYDGNTDSSPAPPAIPPLPTSTTGKLNDGGYWIQLGAYSSEETAVVNGNTLVDELELEISPFIEKISDSGKNLYRLRLGPYPDRSESERILALTKIVDGFSGSYIVRK